MDPYIVLALEKGGSWDFRVTLDSKSHEEAVETCEFDMEPVDILVARLAEDEDGGPDIKKGEGVVELFMQE